MSISSGLDFELFSGENVVCWMNKTLGALGKNTRYILKQTNVPNINFNYIKLKSE